MKAARGIGYDFERGTEGPSMHSLRFNLSWMFRKGFSNDLCQNQFDFLSIDVDGCEYYLFENLIF